MIKLFHCSRSRSFRVLWALEELGQPYELVSLTFPPRVFAQHFLTENPLGTVPLFLDEEKRMTESVAICQHLASKYSPQGLSIDPADPEYAQYLDLCYYGEASLMFPLAVSFRCSYVEPEERRLPQAVEDYRKFFVGRLRKLDELLEDGRQFVCANRLTVADISVGFALQFASTIGLGDSNSEAAKRYLGGLQNTESFKRALAIDTSANDKVAAELAQAQN